MLPYITVFSRIIPTYGIMTAFATIVSILYIKFSVFRRYPALEADLQLATIYAVLGVFVGAKVLYLLTILPEFLAALPLLWENPEGFVNRYLSGGFVFYGGLYGGIFAAWCYAKIARVPFRQVSAALTPIIPLFHGIARIGCFLTGCCYGRQSSFGICYHASPIAPNGVPLLPVQLYEAAIELLLFLLFDRLSRKKAPGGLLPLYLLLYGIARFLLEFLRGDLYRGFFGPLSLSQVMALGSIAICGGVLLRAARRKQPQTGANR